MPEREPKLKPKVDRDLCIGCGVCVSLCPTMFALDEENKSKVISETGCGTDCDCEAVVASCPTSAITLVE